MWGLLDTYIKYFDGNCKIQAAIVKEEINYGHSIEHSYNSFFECIRWETNKLTLKHQGALTYTLKRSCYHI